MILGNPVRGTIYLSPGTASGSARWFRSQRFGCTGYVRERPLGSCAHFHRGVDIARGSAGCGDDLLNMAAGTVVYTGTLNDGAKSVIVYHGGGIATGHVHMSAISVSVGQKVAKGARLGAIGQTGNATGCHDHASGKSNFPGTLRGAAAANAFWNDDVGNWFDVWPQLAQNVTVHPKADPTGIRIRSSLSLDASAIYAETDADGHIHRSSDGADLGATSTARKWYATRKGPAYSVNGRSSTSWEEFSLAGRHVFVATLLASRSA